MLDRLEILIGKENINILKNKTVLVLGLGGVGGYVVEALVRSGIGSIILVDYDKIDKSNLNRQIIALNSNIGKFKTDCFADRIKDINTECVVYKYNTFYDDSTKDIIFEHKIDFVIDACDTVKAKQLIIKECIKRNIKFISSMGTGNKLDPSKLMITELKKTSYDPLAKVMRKWMNTNDIKEHIPVLVSTEIPIKTNSITIGSTPFVPSSAGLLIASYVIKNMINL